MTDTMFWEASSSPDLSLPEINKPGLTMNKIADKPRVRYKVLTSAPQNCQEPQKQRKSDKLGKTKTKEM